MSTKSDTIVASKEQSYDFFFYGTLAVPVILQRVLGHKGDSLTFQDAILPNFTRHRVKGETYPAIVETKLLANNEIDGNTRGTLVRGLNYADVTALDLFEGTEYKRVQLPVRALGDQSPIKKLPEVLANPTARAAALDKENGVQEGDTTDAWAYVWSDPLERLEPGIWGFEEFIKAKSSLWKDLPSDWFTDVERHRGSSEDSDGDESKIEGKTVEGSPEFGHDMLKYWKFNGYVNLNHGSYGSPPRPVIEYMRELSDQIEGNPDLFMRRTYFALLDQVREETAALIGAVKDEVVIVPNTTHGVNNVVTNLEWNDGDIIINYATTYGAVAQTLKYLADTHPNIRVETINVNFPTSHASIVQATDDLLGKYNEVAGPNYTGQSKATGKKPDERVKLVLVDAIASNPGVIFPWEAIVGTCKKYGVISVVDAAHAIGQIKTDVKKADPDFWVSNCHKWLLSHRGGAVLYVPTRNQHLIRSTFPTSAGYESTRYPTPGANRKWEWASQYTWTGTVDWAPYFSVIKALEFRRSIGGEDRIMNYTHTLAVEGAKRVRKIWGTQIMENSDGELTASMCNVEIPYASSPKDVPEQLLQQRYIDDELFKANTFIAAFRHDGKWWARFSAQVWNDLSDFEYAAKVLLRIGKEVQEGKYKKQDISEAETKEQAKGLPAQDQ
ncbi:hypothetical protein CI109_105361 [Kwoniella shandongensis]|uniref:Aminotransferase class V domain-containing protein n=1 Tax=Kwoniella shandongensis TaxID=1734106 RepID=A0AAJ8LN41_9TREE